MRLKNFRPLPLSHTLGQWVPKSDFPTVDQQPKEQSGIVLINKRALYANFIRVFKTHSYNDWKMLTNDCLHTPLFEQLCPNPSRMFPGNSPQIKHIILYPYSQATMKWVPKGCSCKTNANHYIYRCKATTEKQNHENGRGARFCPATILYIIALAYAPWFVSNTTN